MTEKTIDTLDPNSDDNKGKNSYSKNSQQFLNKFKVNVGSEVKIVTKRQEFFGIILPRYETFSDVNGNRCQCSISLHLTSYISDLLPVPSFKGAPKLFKAEVITVVLKTYNDSPIFLYDLSH